MTLVRLEQHRKEANGLRDSVTALERRRRISQLAVRRLDTTAALSDRLRVTFPELGDTTWGLTRLPIGDGDTRYVAELQKPRFELPSPLGLIGAAAVGLVVGRVLR